MVAKALKARLMTTALFGAALFSAGQASAASYSVSLDPAFGGTVFPTLSWEAEGVIDVPAACLAQGNGAYDDVALCAGTVFTSMSVTFYETGDLGGPEQQTFNVNLGPVSINGLDIFGNQLVGVSAGFFSDFGPSCPGDASCGIAGNGLYSFALILTGGGINNNSGSIAYGLNPTTGGASAVCSAIFGISRNCGVSTVNPTVLITPVPEPETYALMLAGLAAVGFMARRRRMV